MRILRHEWFWAVVVLAVFLLVAATWNPHPCKSGYYWEQGIGCTRE